MSWFVFSLQRFRFAVCSAHSLSVCPVYAVSPRVSTPKPFIGSLESKIAPVQRSGTQRWYLGALVLSPRPNLSQGNVSHLRLLSPYVGAVSGSWFRDATTPTLGSPRKFEGSWVKELAGMVLSLAAAKPGCVLSHRVGFSKAETRSVSYLAKPQQVAGGR